MAGHTSGPWAAEFSIYLDDQGNPKIAANVKSGPYSTIAGIMPVPEYVANAKLIAAAPELLEACQALIEFQDYVFPFGQPLHVNGHPIDHTALNRACSVAQAAVRKAEGKTAAPVEVTPAEATAIAVDFVKKAVGL